MNYLLIVEANVMIASNYLQLYVMRVSEHFVKALHIICPGLWNKRVTAETQRTFSSLWLKNHNPILMVRIPLSKSDGHEANVQIRISNSMSTSYPK